MSIVINADVPNNTRLSVAIPCAIRLAKTTMCTVKLNYNGDAIYIYHHTEYNEVNNILEGYRNGKND